MVTVTIPTDPRNPGQVFACLGLMELTAILCGGPTGRFGRDQPTFQIECPGERNPIAECFGFLRAVSIEVLPSPIGDSEQITALPLTFSATAHSLRVGHWADPSSRDPFKLYAGNRSAASIAADMLSQVKTLDLLRLLSDPWNTLCPMAGSFNFDPRGGWTAIGTGFSPNQHATKGGNVMASPAVEMLAAIGLEHARPGVTKEKRGYVYAVWHRQLPLPLARAALGGGLAAVPLTRFRFVLEMSGKNKVAAFAQQEESNE